MDETELSRYSRQMLMWGISGQKKLRNFSVGVIGLNSLAVEVCKTLLLSGFGNIKIYYDLPFLHPPNSISGVNTTHLESVVERLKSLNPYSNITLFQNNLRNSLEPIIILSKTDLVVMCIDQTTDFNYLVCIEDECKKNRIPFLCGMAAVTCGFVNYPGRNWDEESESLKSIFSLDYYPLASPLFYAIQGKYFKDSGEALPDYFQKPNIIDVMSEFETNKHSISQLSIIGGCLTHIMFQLLNDTKFSLQWNFCFVYQNAIHYQNLCKKAKSRKGSLFTQPNSMCLQTFIHEPQKILVVGAGGNGCEIVKNLALSGSHYIDIVDMDTIEVSNFNRQYFYNESDLDRYKAEVLAERAKQLNPECTIQGITKSILKWFIPQFKPYSVIISAVDNNEARHHINLCCLALNIPVIDTGAMSYSGHVCVIKKGVTECIACNTPTRSGNNKASSCTVSNAPPKTYGDCITWAEYYLRVFIAKQLPLNEVYELLFIAGLEKAIKVNPECKSVTLQQKELENQIQFLNINNQTELINNSAANYALFKNSVTSLLKPENKDKIDLNYEVASEDILGFVISAANLRAISFFLDIKCGSLIESRVFLLNKVPSVPSSNCIVGGIVVAHAINHLFNNDSIQVHLGSIGPMMSRQNSPKSGCSVCNKKFFGVRCHFKAVTVQNIVDLIKQEYLTDEIILISLKYGTLYDGEDTHNPCDTLEKIDIGKLGYLVLLVVRSCLIMAWNEDNVPMEVVNFVK